MRDCAHPSLGGGVRSMGTVLSEAPCRLGAGAGGVVPSTGPTVFWGLRLWAELERTLPGMQAKLPGEPAPDLLWASAGQGRDAQL